MNERIPVDDSRPTVPWGGMVLVVLAIVGALSIVGFVLRTIFWFVKVGIVVAVAAAVISLVVGRKAER